MNARLHSSCVVCGAHNPRGLGVTFTPQPDGSCATDFPCDVPFQGFDGVVHGGIVAALLDGAMASCLLHRGEVAHTGQFSMRFRHPVVVGEVATVRAWIAEARHGVHRMAAELVQAGQVRVVAAATFVGERVAGKRTLDGSVEA